MKTKRETPILTRAAAVKTPLLLVLVAFAMYCAAGSYFVENAEPNGDEGFYAYASFDVFQGKVPYRDFAYTQTPLFPYLQGAPMTLTGFGVRQERWLNVAWGALGIGLAVALWLKSGLRPGPCLALAALWCLCRALVYFDTIGKTYSMSQLLLLAAAWFCLPARRPLLNLAVLSLLCTAAVGCRLTVAPCVLVLWLGFAAAHWRRMHIAYLVAIPLAAALAILGPFYAASPSNAVFFTWQYHLQNAAVGLHPIGTLLDSFLLLSGIAILGLVGLVAWLWSGRPYGPGHGIWILAAGLAGWICAVGSSGVYSEYAIPCAPLVITGSGLILADIAAARPWTRFQRQMTFAGLLLLCGIGAFFGKSFVMKGYLDALDETAAMIRRSAGPDETVLTSMPEIALESGHPFFPGLEMGKFAVTGEMSPETAHRRHLLTFMELRRAVAAKSCPWIVFFATNDYWNFGLSVPSFHPIPDDAYRTLIADLLANYRLVHSDGYFLAFKARTGPTRQDLSPLVPGILPR